MTLPGAGAAAPCRHGRHEREGCAGAALEEHPLGDPRGGAGGDRLQARPRQPQLLQRQQLAQQGHRLGCHRQGLRLLRPRGVDRNGHVGCEVFGSAWHRCLQYCTPCSSLGVLLLCADLCSCSSMPRHSDMERCNGREFQRYLIGTAKRQFFHF